MIRLIALLAPMVLLLGLGLDLYLPLEKKIMQSLNFNFQQIQLTLSIYMYFFGLGQLLMGPITDYFGRKYPLKICLVLFTVGSLVIATYSDYYLILASRALQAFGACGAMVISLALVRDSTEGPVATRAFTYIKGVSTLAPIIAPTLGVLLALQWGWRADFYFLTVWGLVALFCSYLITYPQHQIKSDMSTFKNYQEIFSNKEFRKYAFSAAAVQATMFGYFSISPVIYINLLDLSEEMFALLFSLNAVMFLVIAFSLAHFIAKIGVHKSIQIAGGLFLLAGCTMLLTYQLIGLKVITLFGPCLISSIGAAFALGASNNGAMKPFKEQSGKAAGLLGCIEFMIGGFVGSFVVSGMVSTTNPLACLLVGVGIFLILNMLLSKEISQSPSVQSINTQ